MFRIIFKLIDTLGRQAKILTNYLNYKLRIHKKKANIHFNKQCLKMEVIPKYATIKMKNTSRATLKTKQEAEIS